MQPLRTNPEEQIPITVHQRARPLRFGFARDPRDADSVRSAIEASNVVWGGCYNALIPVYRALPRTLRGEPHRDVTRLQRQRLPCRRVFGLDVRLDDSNLHC